MAAKKRTIKLQTPPSIKVFTAATRDTYQPTSIVGCRFESKAETPCFVGPLRFSTKNGANFTLKAGARMDIPADGIFRFGGVSISNADAAILTIGENVKAAKAIARKRRKKS